MILPGRVPVGGASELLHERLGTALAVGAAHQRGPVAVAFSAGSDSTALLHAAVQLWPGRVVAWHVNHGLQEAASTFEAQAFALCAALGVPLAVAQVDARHASGQSPEGVARQWRYAAFAAIARSKAPGVFLNEEMPKIAVKTAQTAIKVIASDDAARATPSAVLLAQHADDQLETVLLALTRGAGLPGLAGMGAAFERGGLHYLRPWLAAPQSQLRQALAERGVRGVLPAQWQAEQCQTLWLEDPSNASSAYTRNRIRHEVLPAVLAAFPQARETFARSAQHAASAQALLSELAQADLEHCGQPPQIAALQALSGLRQTNALRHWLAGQGTQASAAQLAQLQSQLAACTTRGHGIELKVGSGQVLRHGAALVWAAEAV